MDDATAARLLAAMGWLHDAVGALLADARAHGMPAERQERTALALSRAKHELEAAAERVGFPVRPDRSTEDAWKHPS